MEARLPETTPVLLVPVCGCSAATLRRMNDVLRGFQTMGIDAPAVSTRCPFSAVKHIERAVAQCVSQWLSPEGMPKHQTLGLADGYTGVEFHIVQGIESWLFTDELTDDILLNAHDAAVRKEKEMTEK